VIRSGNNGDLNRSMQHFILNAKMECCVDQLRSPPKTDVPDQGISVILFRRLAASQRREVFGQDVDIGIAQILALDGHQVVVALVF